MYNPVTALLPKYVSYPLYISSPALSLFLSKSHLFSHFEDCIVVCLHLLGRRPSGLIQTAPCNRENTFGGLLD